MVQKSITCKACNTKNQGVKSHIIPECFYRAIIPGNEEQPLLYLKDGASFTSRRPIGEYDENILCDKCEKKFGDFDDSGCSILTSLDSLAQIHHQNKGIEVFELKQIDNAMLARFILSVLWRASISEREMFKNINLGSNATVIYDEIFSSTTPKFERYICLLKMAWNEKMITDPVVIKIDEKDFYQLDFGKFTACINLEHQAFSDGHRLKKLSAFNTSGRAYFMRVESDKHSESIILQNIAKQKNLPKIR